MEHVVFLSTDGWYFLDPITRTYQGPFETYELGCDAYNFATKKSTELIDSYAIMLNVYDMAFGRGNRIRTCA